MLLLGFDPRGIGQFGWCVAESGDDYPIRIRAAGTADNAAEAHERTIAHDRDRTQIVAAGIDSPLFWVANGDREADKIIRKAMIDLGAASVHGTVQQVNSLRGACLAPDIMAAHLHRREISDVRLTESHPKALLWLLKVATKKHRVLDVTTQRLLDFVECDSSIVSEHERDAVLGALEAFAMVRGAAGGGISLKTNATRLSQSHQLSTGCLFRDTPPNKPFQASAPTAPGRIACPSCEYRRAT